MKLTAKEFYELKVIDKIIKEPIGDIEESFEITATELKKEIQKAIKEFKNMSEDEIIEQRYQKFRNMGEYKIIEQ